MNETGKAHESVFPVFVFFCLPVLSSGRSRKRIRRSPKRRKISSQNKVSRLVSRVLCISAAIIYLCVALPRRSKAFAFCRHSVSDGPPSLARTKRRCFG